MSSPLVGTASAADAVARVSYTHDGMIDLILTNPGISQNAIARHFGYSAAWVSRVRNSDAFLARLAERKRDITDPVITATLEEDMRALASMSLSRIMEKLEQPIQAAGVADTALKAFDLSTRALGYGAKQQNVAVQQNFVVALPAKMESAEQWAAMGLASGAGAGTKALPMLEVVEQVPVGAEGVE